MEGRILFYNDQTGQGKLILQSGEKLDFSADVWDDFETAPKAGGLVVCTMEGEALKSVKAAGSSPVEEKEAEEPRESEPKPVKTVSSKPTFSVEETLTNYFQPVEFLIGEPPEVVNTREQLDFFLVKRFLMTAYNNLRSLDPALYEQKEVREKADELQRLHKAYQTVQSRVETPKLAFEIVFLRSQPEYLRFIRHKEHCLSRISALTQVEESLFPDIRKKEEELAKIPRDQEEKKNALEQELKNIRRHYVEAIHENASLSEELVTMDDLKTTYTEKYYDLFVGQLHQQGAYYLNVLGKILGYRAYSFDKLVWQNAEHSKPITEYFRQGGIVGGYSTLTYLKYYLKTLDKGKIDKEHKDLFKLLGYLETRE